MTRIANANKYGAKAVKQNGRCRTIPRVCQVCGVHFLAEAAEVHRGNAQFCSRSCQSVSLRRDMPTRFWAKVNKTADCWVWTASTYPNGYGIFSIGHGVLSAAHRVAYQLVIGPIPDGLELDHLCRNHLCVNPCHLEPVTHRENTLRGRSQSALNAKVTHCPKGHSYDETNTGIRPKGERSCRACDRARHQKRAAELGYWRTPEQKARISERRRAKQIQK